MQRKKRYTAKQKAQIVLEGLPGLFEENPKADKTLRAEHERER